MDFFVETEELQRIIKSLNQLSPERVLIKAEEDIVSFVANDGTNHIVATSEEAKVEEPGSIVVPFGKIKSFSTSFSPWNGEYGTKNLRFLFKDNIMKMSVKTTHKNGKTASGSLKLDYFDTSYIVMPKEFERTDFVLNSNMFKKSIVKVLYAIDTNNNRVSLQGMNLKFDKDDIYFAGTNGRAISEFKVKNSNKLADGSFTMMHRFIVCLKNLLGEETQMFFQIDDRLITVKFDNICFYGKLVIGENYPKYQSMFDEYKNSFVVEKDMLLESIKPFRDVLDHEDNNRLTLKFEGGKLFLSTKEMSLQCDFDVDYKEDFVIDVNGKFLYNSIDVIEDDKIITKFSNDKGYLIFDSGNFEDQKALLAPIMRR